MVANGAVVGRVAEVWRFPVKSMQGERLDEVAVSSGGVVGDRGWALIDTSDGKVVSAKNPRKWPRMLELRARCLAAPAPGSPPPPVEIALPDGTLVRSDEPGVHGVLSSFLGREVRLEATSPAQRLMEETWPDIEGLAPESFIAGTRIDTGVPEETVSDIQIAMAAPEGTFFDLAVLHLLTTSTLAELTRLHPDGAFDVRRYRPNVLVADDGAGFVENAWVGKRVGLGEAAAMRVSMPTMRCIMTTLAQEELPRDPDTLRTIAAANRLEIEGLGTWACAGVYGDAASPGTVRVGDPVSLQD